MEASWYTYGMMSSPSCSLHNKQKSCCVHFFPFLATGSGAGFLFLLLMAASSTVVRLLFPRSFQESVIEAFLFLDTSAL